jgi:hypothetical protein
MDKFLQVNVILPIKLDVLSILTYSYISLPVEIAFLLGVYLRNRQWNHRFYRRIPKAITIERFSIDGCYTSAGVVDFQWHWTSDSSISAIRNGLPAATVIFSVPVTCRDLRGLYHIFHNVHDLDINIYEQLHRWACFDVSTKLDIGRFSVDTYEVMISGGTGGSVRGHGPPSSTTNIFNTS